MPNSHVCLKDEELVEAINFAKSDASPEEKTAHLKSLMERVKGCVCCRAEVFKVLSGE